MNVYALLGLIAGSSIAGCIFALYILLENDK